MQTRQLVIRSLTYYWRTNLSVVLGVATAVAVLSGALLVGDSIRGSLRDLVLQRIGRSDQVVASGGFFRAALSDDVQRSADFRSTFAAVSPLIILPGAVTDQASGRRAGEVQVYGVDDRFWRFHGVSGDGPGDRDALISAALAQQLGVDAGGSILVRVNRPSDVPLESLHGRKDDVGRTVRVTVRAVIRPEALGEFSLEPQQGSVHAAFLSMSRLQQELEVAGRVNTLLLANLPGRERDAAAILSRLVRASFQLEDVELFVKAIEPKEQVAVASPSGLLDDARAGAARQAIDAAGMQSIPVFTYLANRLRHGTRDVPYSLVTAIDLELIAPGMPAPAEAVTPPPMVLNAWAARELQARPGDPIAMEYYVWEEPGQLVTRTTGFRVAGVVPIEAGDRDLAPIFPGISDSASLTDWDPPFAIDLRRIRPVDEAYWDAYRTIPKAYIPIATGQRLWRSRYGAVTSIRAAVVPGQPAEPTAQRVADELRAGIDPLAAGLVVRDVRAESLAASRGATNFGEYFLYFSFFLVVAALLLASLFFKLGVEQRAREVGLLRAIGFGPAQVRRLFILEGALLACAGSILGVGGGVAYAALLMAGLRTWWFDAVGTTALTLHTSALSLAAGAAGGVAAAVACIWLTLRSLGRVSERSLLAGQLSSDLFGPARVLRTTRLKAAALGLAAVGAGLVAAAAIGAIEGSGAFFGAGAALLGGMLCAFAVAFRRRATRAIQGHGWVSVARLGLRNTTYRPGRSVVSVAVIAFATFILVSVDAFRRDGQVAADDRRSGTGGYALMVESLLPIVQNPNTREGREALNLFDLDQGVHLEPFRLLPGDDASCLNLYEPRNPRIVAPRDSFLAEARFTFQDALATTVEERENPWLLLHREHADGAIPVIADANSMTYVLHRRLGEELVLERGARTIRLRFVGALRDSVFQRELLMSEANFVTLFPAQAGYRLLMVDQSSPASDVISTLENSLADYGADAVGTADQLAAFHRVENTYLSTFQTLGGLGLLLGIVGLGAVLLRNAFERRRELALLGAVGYERRHFVVMVLAENVLLLGGGLLAGAAAASLAIAPAVVDRGGRFPIGGGGAVLLFAVLGTGLLSSVLAMRTAMRRPLLEALRSE
ncbi:MAG: FtsX-like permease family protein [Luteitalea sp.]|nr:FtsX-like permease family protein [Luteitalea sp.]